MSDQKEVIKELCAEIVSDEFYLGMEEGLNHPENEPQTNGFHTYTERREEAVLREKPTCHHCRVELIKGRYGYECPQCGADYS